MRNIVWFSCGAASAVAAKLSTERFPCNVVYCDVSKDEHLNFRFRADVERWIGQKVEVIKSSLYDSVDDVFEGTHYMAGIRGARCTQEMKRIPRLKYQKPDDIHIFGFTCEEDRRILDFETNNTSIKVKWILMELGINKKHCFQILQEAGIELPEMYKLGYRNNNCIGCVKATSPGYWNAIREDFPEVFAARAARSRELGVRLVRVKGKRMFLDELPVEARGNFIREDVSCGPQCGLRRELSSGLEKED